MKFLKAIWDKTPESWKSHIVSFFHTFIAVLVVSIVMQLYAMLKLDAGGNISVDTLTVSKDMLFALLIGAFRQAVKASFTKEVLPTPPASN